MKKHIQLLALFMAISMVLTACGSAAPAPAPGSTPSSEAAPAPAAKQRYAILFKSAGNPYGEKMMEGFKNEVEALGHEAITKAPDQPTAEAQIQMVEELIAQKVDAIYLAANDADALQPVLEKAMKAGIKVFTGDSGVNPAGRMVHVNQADTQKIGETLVEAAFDMTGGSGEFAVLSATSQATNQNAWIAVMQETLKQDKYKDLKLVKVAYGDDVRDKSVSETEALLKSYPNLKCIVAPTTVGIAAAGKVLTDKGLKDKVALTGLGLPSEMAEYIENGVCKYMYLWNPIDLGYLGAHTAVALVEGKITGKEGDKFSAGRLGDYTITKAGDGGTEVLMGPPFKFDAANIKEWKTVY